ncbi:MAG TPA: hypothetical protein VD998_01160 [Verrucomicrobiae bacterium]|nr:hypothetical protein [Verrucomicrobiae bacterium]
MNKLLLSNVVLILGGLGIFIGLISIFFPILSSNNVYISDEYIYVPIGMGLLLVLFGGAVSVYEGKRYQPQSALVSRIVSIFVITVVILLFFTVLIGLWFASSWT